MVDGYRETLVRNGAITAFSTTPALDYVAGNATAAYGGALSSADVSCGTCVTVMPCSCGTS
jgi:hypothetical protein